jgi:Ricin-type beta-trefoil lectin domain
MQGGSQASAGSTAGRNGDKVQLWTCTGNNNQSWIPIDWETPLPPGVMHSAATRMVNAKYQSECLNADDSHGLANGSKVQLWSCIVRSLNGQWLFPYWYGKGSGSRSNFRLAIIADFVLDAKSQSLGNGDKIQIWHPGGGTYQDWRQ